MYCGGQGRRHAILVPNEVAARNISRCHGRLRKSSKKTGPAEWAIINWSGHKLINECAALTLSSGRCYETPPRGPRQL